MANSPEDEAIRAQFEAQYGDGAVEDEKEQIAKKPKSPHVAQRRVPHSPDLMTSNLSLADQIAMTGHALTANELARVLPVSRITIFKQAKAGRIPSFASVPASAVIPCLWRSGYVECKVGLFAPTRAKEVCQDCAILTRRAIDGVGKLRAKYFVHCKVEGVLHAISPPIFGLRLRCLYESGIFTIE